MCCNGSLLMATLAPELPRVAPDRDHFNIATWLVERHVLAGRGDQPAIYLPDAIVSYRELERLTNQAANALRLAGVQPEQRVALVLYDSPLFVASFVGALKIGAV